ncbi:ABC multidrug transporter [Penicillium cinerascens]|uniref:ABC multidrug transporter n=1 Tax=Penicillium cinerascens TaxID=70096 RepID=A0A9W9NAR5_9EURO|nr:ABC multidrug transporter [Penicillium cinerascens]KAJ5216416.1 ABC multidrug transporter [Penicillium cinerascens]
MPNLQASRANIAPNQPLNGSNADDPASLDLSTSNVSKISLTLNYKQQATATTTKTAEDQQAVENPVQTNRKCQYSFNPLKWGKMPPVPLERSPSGEYGANWLSQMTFQWMNSIMSVGYRRPLELNDIWLVNPDRQIDKLSARFNTAFKQQMERRATCPLFMALHDTFKREFWLGALCVFFASICQVMTPFSLRFLIKWLTAAYYKHDPGEDTHGFGKQIGLVFGIMGMQIIQSFGTNQFIYRGFMVGAQARGVLISAIFEKTMKISHRARAGTQMSTTSDHPDENKPDNKPKSKRDTQDGMNTDEAGSPNGRVMNMMSTDTSRIELACGMFHLLWVSPLTILLALALLVINMTYSALAGFGLLFLGIPLLTLTMRSLIQRRRMINKITDTRISLTQEITRSVRFVKFYGWEKAFLEALRACRRNEVTMIQKLMALRNAMNAVSVSLPIFASMLCFIVYSVSGHELNASLVFSSLSIFNSLRVPLNLLPVVIGQMTDAWASMRRVQNYLLAEDQREEFIWDFDAAQAIDVQNASFVWEHSSTTVQAENSKASGRTSEGGQEQTEKSENISTCSSTASLVHSGDFTLENINLSVGRSDLVAVIGKVGSGKSSLLSALAGEMRKTDGLVTMGATRAFCPQSAWIQNATVRNNILFGKVMDRQWYEEVIRACALKPDLDMLPAGDETEIGERGITLSGGQRQRLNIARAIYFDSPIILLDDPLSAVDAHVGRHLFDRAICGLLGNKCRILATNRHDILCRCDKVIWMDEGRIKAVDTYDNLIASNSQFSELMASNTRDEAGGGGPSAQQSPTELTTDEKILEPASLIQDEDRSVLSIDWSVYIAYIRASGSIWYGIIPFFLLAIAQSANILTNLWLSYWTDGKFSLSKGQYIGIYIAFGVIQAALMFLFSLSVSMLATRASRTMMGKALAGVLRAPMSFFDTTPLGRIINRFSKDVDTMDNALADAIRMYLYTLAMILSVFILLIVYFHYFGIVIGPLLLLFLAAAAYYRASARDMKRHEAVLRSAVFARFSEAISGTASIRAYGLQNHFTSVLQAAIDDMNSAYYLTFSNQRWLTMRLDAISILLVATTGVLVVTLRHVVSPSISGLVFSYILTIVQMIQLLVKQFAELENAMNATERVHFYGSNLAREEDEESTSYNPLSVDRCWPKIGSIEFDDVHMRYRPGLPLVLQGLTLHVAGGERIGIVGRTGAGKSSIMSALFRLTELARGSIKIDGIDISRVSCHDLRSRLSIIPQDPTLFLGNIRTNLDPFKEHTDLELQSALRQVGLTREDSANSASKIHLDSPVEEEGQNFSLGQRQLLALARALVRDSQIVVCDEATSSVDLETDRNIQETIRTKFRGKTLLCIAHRLQTIITYDKVCVMDKGVIAELDTPLNLWESGGLFRGMCDQSVVVRQDFFD